MKRLVLSVTLSIILVMTGLTCAFAQEEITLSLWSFTDELTRPIERFEQMYPNIKIELTIVPSEEYPSKLKPVLRTGKNAPDIFTGEFAYVKDFVESGFWATEPHPLPYKMPLEPRGADGNPDQWNAIERAILERRSVRNFEDKPVPDHLIRRVLEAGRFAPSAGNCQPWQFIVITDRELIRKVDEATWATVNGLHNMYTEDEQVMNRAPKDEANPGMYDERVANWGLGSIDK